MSEFYDAFSGDDTGSVFYLTYEGEITFGGADAYEGWIDTLTKEQTFELYESLKALFDEQ